MREGGSPRHRARTPEEGRGKNQLEGMKKGEGERERGRGKNQLDGERERERERGREREQEQEQECVCVCVREREKGGECEKNIVKYEEREYLVLV